MYKGEKRLSGRVNVSLFLTIIVSSPGAKCHSANQQEDQQQYSCNASNNCRESCRRIWEKQNRTFTLWVLSHWCNSWSHAVGSGRVFTGFWIILFVPSHISTFMYIQTVLSVLSIVIVETNVLSFFNLISLCEYIYWPAEISQVKMEYKEHLSSWTKKSRRKRFFGHCFSELRISKKTK